MKALGAKSLESIPTPDAGSFPEKWVKAVAEDMLQSPQKAAVIVGPRQPAWVHAVANAINVSTASHIGLRNLRIEPRPNDPGPAIEFLPPPARCWRRASAS